MDSMLRGLQGLYMGSTSRTSQDHLEAAYREHELGLQHKIFISYSGADVAFVMELYHDLRDNLYDPFFDQASLPKGVSVSMRNIVQEAANCRLAVFYLSEGFLTRNKNPMLEVATCVRAGVQLFPIFDSLRVDAIKANYDKWYTAWRKWGILDDQFHEFKNALRILLGVSGIENRQNSTPREFRRRVVQEIRKVIAPEMLPDVSDIRGQARLVQFVKELFTSAFASPMPQTSHNHQRPLIVGVYGEHGTGKTTLCKILENHAAEFGGLPVCYVHLQDSSSEKQKLERMKAVLRKVTYLDKTALDQLNTTSAAQHLLLQRTHDRSVFLIIDNIVASRTSTDHEAKIYLKGKFKEGSRVLITAHSPELLSRISENCREVRQMPDLEEEEARQILLQVEELKQQPSALNRCLKLCYLQKGGGARRVGWNESRNLHYHPLVLTSLATSLMENGPYNYEQLAKRITFLESKSASHEVAGKRTLQLLRSLSYDLLPSPALKQIFLDIALCVPSSVSSGNRLHEWLSLLHDSEDIEHSVRVLIRAGLLNGFVIDGGRYMLPWVHDLYCNMAIAIAKEDGSKWLFVRGNGKKMVVDHLRLPQDCVQIRRMVLIDCSFRNMWGVLDLSSFPCLQVLKLQGCIKLDIIYVGSTRMSLCSVEIEVAHYPARLILGATLQDGEDETWIDLTGVEDKPSHGVKIGGEAHCCQCLRFMDYDWRRFSTSKAHDDETSNVILHFPAPDMAAYVLTIDLTNQLIPREKFSWETPHLGYVVRQSENEPVLWAFRHDLRDGGHEEVHLRPPVQARRSDQFSSDQFSLEDLVEIGISIEKFGKSRHN